MTAVPGNLGRASIRASSVVFRLLRKPVKHRVRQQGRRWGRRGSPHFPLIPPHVRVIEAPAINQSRGCRLAERGRDREYEVVPARIGPSEFGLLMCILRRHEFLGRMPQGWYDHANATDRRRRCLRIRTVCGRPRRYWRRFCIMRPGILGRTLLAIGLPSSDKVRLVHIIRVTSLTGSWPVNDWCPRADRFRRCRYKWANCESAWLARLLGNPRRRYSRSHSIRPRPFVLRDVGERRAVRRKTAAGKLEPDAACCSLAMASVSLAVGMGEPHACVDRGCRRHPSGGGL